MTSDESNGDQRLDEALDRVLDQEPDSRLAFIQTEFGRDPELRDRLTELVRASVAGEALLSDADRAARELMSTQPGTGSVVEDPPPMPNTIGAYRVLDRLGSGGMGTVYLAERLDGEVERQVALKVITGAAHRSDIRRRFLTEQRILSRLEHPNIARLYDVGVDEGGVPYFVMEYVDGSPVDQYADDRSLSVEQRLGLIRQVTDALSYAHRNLVVHRDVKPSNILVTADGTVKLLDFGVAKLLDESAASGPPLTRPGAPLLTPEYASPEQIRGEAVTTATDVYATGILLYELLTGARPYDFTSRSPVHIEQVVSRQDARSPSAVAATISLAEARSRDSTPPRLSRALTGDLDAIILTALRKEPQGRYGSIQELAADIDRTLRNEPIEARTPTWRYRAGRFAARHRAALAASALVVLALAAGVATTWWQARIAIREAARAERVKELLVGLFEGSDPDVAAGSELTAIDLLARGEETLLAPMTGEPLIQAELQMIVGSIYTSLGEYERADPLLRSAVALSDEFGGPDEQASTRAAHSDLLYLTGAYAEGETVAREVLTLRQETHPEGSVEVAAAMTDLATFLQNQGRYDEAEAILRDALELDRARGATSMVATDLNNLGTLLTRASRYDEAITALEESLALREDLHPDGHTDVATSLANLAWALDRQGSYERADSAYETTLALRRKLFGNEHPLVATVLNNQATMRQQEGRLEESRALHRQALEIRRAVFGDDHADVAASLNNLAIVSYFERDYDEAEELFREALRVFRIHRAEDHPHVLTGVGNLAAVFRAQGKLDEAEALIRSTLETRIRVLGPDHHDTGGAWNNLGGVLRDRGLYREAEAPIRRAVEIFEAALEPDHPDLADARLNLGRVLVAQGRGGEWIEGLEASCATTATRYDDDHAMLAGCRAVLGLALLDAGRAAEGRRYLEATIDVLERDRPDDPWTARVRGGLDRTSGS